MCTLSSTGFTEICASAVRAAGGSADVAASLSRATCAAEQRGKSVVGADHLLDYLAALRAGRLNGGAVPRVHHPRGAVTRVDADDGPAQLAFDAAVPQVIARARDLGVAVLGVHRAFTAGELGYYASRIADDGLIALACANSPALMSIFGSDRPLTGTNPMAFAVPHPLGPRVFDQASSAAAWVQIRQAAETGTEIPRGWAVDAHGDQTTDATAALEGALLPFGGVKGSNIAVMIDLLSALVGASFSREAPSFTDGHHPPRLGLCIIAIDPDAFVDDFVHRAEDYLAGLHRDWDIDFGRRRAPLEYIRVAEPTLQALIDTGRDRADEGAGT